MTEPTDATRPLPWIATISLAVVLSAIAGFLVLGWLCAMAMVR